MSDADKRSIFDMEPDEAQQARLEAEAEAEIEAGKGVPHERVSEWLVKLARGERVPPPAS
jgi:predicted transcriptional regulator